MERGRKEAIVIRVLPGDQRPDGLLPKPETMGGGTSLGRRLSCILNAVMSQAEGQQVSWELSKATDQVGNN